MTTKILAFLEENEPKKQVIEEALKVIDEEIKTKTEELESLTDIKQNNAGNLASNIKKTATLRAELKEFEAMKTEKQRELKDLVDENYYDNLGTFAIDDINKPFDDIVRKYNDLANEKVKGLKEDLKRLKKEMEEETKAKQEELRPLRRRVSEFMPKEKHVDLMSMLIPRITSNIDRILSATEWL